MNREHLCCPSELRYRAILANIGDAIAVIDADGGVVEANPRWEALIGPTDRATNAALVARARAEGDLREEHVVTPPGTGAPVWIELRAHVVELDGRLVAIACGRDVTAHRAAADQVAATEAMYRSLVERIPDIVARGRVDGRVVFLSPSAEAITGIALGRLVAGGCRLWRAQIHPVDLPGVDAEIAAAVHELGSGELEYRFRHATGRWIWLRTRLSIRREDGELIFDALTTDITARRVLEESLAQSQKMELVGRLSGGVAHDFNNFLAVVLANSTFLVEDLAADDPRRRDAEQIQTAAIRASALTRHLLGFSRREAVETTPVDVGELVVGLGTLIGRLLGEDIVVQVSAAPGLGRVQANPAQLEQVVMNLAVNARDAMPAGGRLQIAACNVEVVAVDDVVEVRGVGGAPVASGSYVLVTVTDTGCGMDAATLAQIFEPFFTTKEPGKGTGLGLSTCHRIVEQLHGRIRVRSEPGRGSVFEVYLPRTDAPAASAGVPLAAAAGGAETILVIEDDPHVRGVVGRVLAARGYHVLSAGDGEEALRIARGHADPIALVLSDVILPGLSGPEVAAALNHRSPIPRTLLMSGFADHDVVRDSLTAGALSFIEKPFSPALLVRKVREVLDAPARGR
jgi:two-component system cell cycle sensor histidine kinase/response regulator CckA